MLRIRVAIAVPNGSLRCAYCEFFLPVCTSECFFSPLRFFFLRLPPREKCVCWKDITLQLSIVESSLENQFASLEKRSTHSSLSSSSLSYRPSSRPPIDEPDNNGSLSCCWTKQNRRLMLFCCWWLTSRSAGILVAVANSGTGLPAPKISIEKVFAFWFFLFI